MNDAHDSTTRREVLVAAAGAAASLGCAPLRQAGRLPALFVSHGSPMVALATDDYAAALRRFGAAQVPSAILVVSAHWETHAVRVTGAAWPETLHDFGGFAEALYRLSYPAPGAPELAQDVATRLAGAGFAAEVDASRGLDHGAWIPLRLAFPDARIPVVQVSLPLARDPAVLARMGAALAPLRDRGVLLVGSGGVVHNLRRVNFRDAHAAVEPWAQSFDRWIGERVSALDAPALARWPDAPHARDAVPSSEHFDPLLVVLGSASDGERVEHVYEGFRHGTLSMRCFAVLS
ncbi:MAG: dioxygenase [Myxococcales bacterium]